MARHGNGNFAYLDTEAEAEKVLVKELTRSLYAVAVNVTVELTLDDKLTKRYRLMGYDNRLEALRVGANKLIGGEIGSGYALVSVLELEPVDSAAGWRMANENEQMGTVAVSYALPGAPADARQALHSVPFNHAPFATIDRRLQLAAAVAMWGNMLRHPERISEGDFTLLENIARQAVDPTNPQQAEFLKLVLQSKQLYQPVEKPNRKKWLKPKHDN